MIIPYRRLRHGRDRLLLVTNPAVEWQARETMETTQMSSVILAGHPAVTRDGMSDSEWWAATRFDSTDVGWVMMSIGMAIGAGIVFCRFRLG